MLPLPSDVSPVNRIEAEVYHLSEWRCVLRDAINVYPLDPLLHGPWAPRVPFLQLRSSESAVYPSAGVAHDKRN
jgi:hypothetical protein